MLRVLNNSGFQLELSNNLTVSVMFGVHNDCARKDTTEFLKRLDKIKNKDFLYPDDNWASKNASVCVILTSAENETHINVPGYKYYSGERSLGWVPADEVANIISKVSKMRLKDIAENLVKEPLTQPAKNNLENFTQEELDALVVEKKAEEARLLNKNSKEEQIEYLLGWPEFDPDPELFYENRN